jgi:hypothetical protein
MEATAPGASKLWRQRGIIVAIISLTIPAAWFHGVTLHRWDHQLQRDRFEHVLDDLPDVMGSWQMVAEGRPLSANVQRKLQLWAYTHRIYQHQRTGQRVALLVLLGPSGPLVRHPPEICYDTRANQLLNSRPLTVRLNKGVAEMRLLGFSSDSPASDDFYVAYAFGSDQQWTTPSSPRIAFAGKPMLYKIQALTEMSNERSTERPAGLIAFLQEIVPLLSAQMASPDAGSGAVPISPR